MSIAIISLMSGQGAVALWSVMPHFPTRPFEHPFKMGFTHCGLEVAFSSDYRCYI